MNHWLWNQHVFLLARWLSQVARWLVLGTPGGFDGWFFAAVLTTGIYCRPSCPAMTPT